MVFGGYIKKIRRNILKDVKGILVIFIQTIDTNINGYVQWNISK